MKRHEKWVHTAKMLRLAINDSMDKHPYFTKEYCMGFCDDCERCTVSPFMVSFYDHDHKHLVSNWLANSFTAPTCAYSSLMEELSDYFDVDISHLMWNGADTLLHKVRYIRVGTRTVVKDEDGYLHTTEVGIEYDVHRGNAIRKYRSTWVSEYPDVAVGYVGCDHYHEGIEQ